MSVQLSVEAIQSRLSSASIGHRILYLPSVNSTMDVARREAEQGAPEGTVVVADEQTAGRGRFGRHWVSGSGQNLLFSVVLYPEQTALAGLNIIASVAALTAIQRTTALSPTLKWPNDILIAGKKMSGILIETAVQDGGVRYAVLGFGINVNFDPSQTPEIAESGTSLSKELGKQVSREALLEAILEELSTLYERLKAWATVRHRWEASLETLGSHVRVQWGDQVEEGVAEAVDPDGNLLLRRSDGTVVTLSGGDVASQG
ncbi:MAG: biotin--[acetyl-CoA-carboxylase] ligase [Chloroflexi bacterium]|nr:biotin--[acetyl-CoA-carboxylase] ligase [Chloroflexota bacterium]